VASEPPGETALKFLNHWMLKEIYQVLVFLPVFAQDVKIIFADITRTYPILVHGLFLYLLSLVHRNETDRFCEID